MRSSVTDGSSKFDDVGNRVRVRLLISHTEQDLEGQLTEYYECLTEPNIGHFLTSLFSLAYVLQLVQWIRLSHWTVGSSGDWMRCVQNRKF